MARGAGWASDLRVFFLLTLSWLTVGGGCDINDMSSNSVIICVCACLNTVGIGYLGA